MYLITQLWTYLAIAFILGALLGYWVWSYCHRRRAGSPAAAGSTPSSLSADAERLARELSQKHAKDLETATLKAEATLAAERQQHQAAMSELRRRSDEAARKLAGDLQTVGVKAGQQAQGLLSAGTHKYEMEIASLRREAEETAKKHEAELALLRGRLTDTGSAAASAGGKPQPAAVKASHGKGGGPSRLDAPRDGKADDLKLIWGVGEALEQKLNELGFWHFDQISAWTSADEKWVSNQIGTNSARVTRDKWVDQCKKLASGWRPEGEAGDRMT